MLAKLHDIAGYISTFLCRKAMAEQARVDLKNPALLGETNFWFQIDPNNGDTILCYNKHPSAWDMDGIMQDIADAEHNILLAEGRFIYL